MFTHYKIDYLVAKLPTSLAAHLIKRKFEGAKRKMVQQMWTVARQEILPENRRPRAAVLKLEEVVANCRCQEENVLG